MTRVRIWRLTAEVVALITTCVLLARAGEEHREVADKEVTLKDVCSNRQVPIISVQTARNFIDELKKNHNECPSNYVQSFFELEPILIMNPQDRLCSEAKFEQIKNYHFRYVNPLVQKYKLGDDLNQLDSEVKFKSLTAAKVDYTVQLDEYKQEILIPIALQQFFKAWVLQVSGECKRTLVENLDKAMQLLTDNDFNIVDVVAKQEADSSGQDPITLKQIDDRQLSFRELIYMPRLEGELEPGDIENSEKVTVLDLRQRPELNKLMHACKLRFKPIYEQLIMPIVRLSKLGYEYVGPKLDDIQKKLTKDYNLKRWLVLTKICEAHRNFELVEDEGEEANFQMEKLNYSPMYNYKVDGDLWIKGAEALNKEFDRLSGFHSTGFKKFLYKTGVAGRKVLAFIDPHQFAWYRRNQNTLSSCLNLMSILSNTASMISSGR